MQKLPRLSGKEVIKVLAKDGFLIARQKGSHITILEQWLVRSRKELVGKERLN